MAKLVGSFLYTIVGFKGLSVLVFHNFLVYGFQNLRHFN